MEADNLPNTSRKGQNLIIKELSSFVQSKNPVYTRSTVGAVERGNQQMLEEITRPLADAGITTSIIENNKDFIVKQAKHLIVGDGDTKPTSTTSTFLEDSELSQDQRSENSSTFMTQIQETKYRYLDMINQVLNILRCGFPSWKQLSIHYSM